VYWIIFFTYLPGVVGLIKLLDFASPGLGDRVGQGIAIAWAAAWMFSGYRRLAIRCPRCGERFVADRWWETRSLSSSECIHCGLPLWSEPTDVEQAGDR
jgi:hypothetical protein